MDLKEIAEKWNRDADEYNQWDNISVNEQVMFAYNAGLERAACIASTRTLTSVVADAIRKEISNV